MIENIVHWLLGITIVVVLVSLNIMCVVIVGGISAVICGEAIKGAYEWVKKIFYK